MNQRRDKTWKNKCKRIIYHICIIVIGFGMIYPVLWMVFASVKSNTDIFHNAASLWPSSFHFENYAIGWKGFGNNTFGIFFRNSFFVTIVSTIGAVASSVLVAYGFARIRFAGRNIGLHA